MFYRILRGILIIPFISICAILFNIINIILMFLVWIGYALITPIAILFFIFVNEHKNSFLCSLNEWFYIDDGSGNDNSRIGIRIITPFLGLETQFFSEAEELGAKRIKKSSFWVIASGWWIFKLCWNWMKKI